MERIEKWCLNLAERWIGFPTRLQNVILLDVVLLLTLMVMWFYFGSG